MGIQSLTATEASAASRFAGIRVDQNRTTGETSFSFLPPSSVPGLQIVTHETITTPPMTSELLKGQQFTIPFNLYTAMTSNPTVNNGADSLVQQRFDNPTVALDQLPGLEHQAHGVQDDRGLRGTLFRLLTPLLPAQDQEPDQRRPN
ncbi:MAG TPA: hypothetical protein PKZ53_27060, partial [Acidobacteriota bacterium]|nr:hypothetical protein [Acidobacteriota bacterium]